MGMSATSSTSLAFRLLLVLLYPPIRLDFTRPNKSSYEWIEGSYSLGEYVSTPHVLAVDDVG